MFPYSTIIFLSLFLPSLPREIKIFNYCPFPTWPVIQGPGNPADGGFKLEQNQTKSIFVDEDWSHGKIWPRTRCNKKMECATGISTFTLAEISLGGEEGMDFYSVSLANGYNIPVLIDAYGGEGSCGRAGGCVKDPNEFCPEKLAVVRGGRTVGCNTDCPVGNADKCKKSPVVRMFKESCPGAFGYLGDDKKLGKSCTGAVYVVQFC